MDISRYQADNLSEKEKRILDAAAKIFSQKGFSAATTNEIAKEAGIAEGTIFRYFRTKKDLLHGVFVQIANIMADKIALPSLEKILADDSAKDAREIIKEIVNDRIQIAENNFPILKVMFSEVLIHDDARQILTDKIVTRLIPAFDRFYTRKVEQGVFRPMKSAIVLRAFTGNIIMLVVQKNMFSDKMPIDNLNEEIEVLIDILLHGISMDKK
ncbi:TetR/AcrR family transcriptional regulator [Petroclostridium sp. X23]|uniref:TetR/AcrR family transcriptional regulator n=1 Tax=Petroclostridium sp. X23 TaxID=3045146 RepID=UPI0024ADA3C6|nr:TetR/AcrR family transcriptional regulator [Petroclostridium sp. X23]WHH61563.1 helix-turn-helix domain-containing protein [Petroclostridium sp. X23]